MASSRLNSNKGRPRSAAPTSIRVGVDTGGTFTDFVYETNGRLQVFKLPSTPSDPSQAIADGLTRVSKETGLSFAEMEVVHGTTVGTNALLQRRGSKIALVTTKGFEDVLVIGRQARPELYNLNAIKPPALVADELRFGVPERVVASSEVIEPLDDTAIRKLLAKVKRARVDAVAICLLFSFLHRDHEERIAEALGELNVPLSISSRILPEYREYERTSTVVINAYLQPLMGRYLKRLSSGSNTFSLRVMQSSGGSISAELAAVEPVRTILSGPSGGVVGALRSAHRSGFPGIVTFDMGGTSTDVALCSAGSINTTNEAVVAGLPVAVPVMDIHTVGAGGGSIARVDEGGSLRVGPESAGADPGPACYGRSELPTVTDAHAVLGHFGGVGLLGAEFPLDEERARKAISRLAEDMSKAAGRKVTTTQAADGVIAVANANMERALRHISVERGHDPRQFALLPFGGAGGLHAVELARSLRMPSIIVPTSPGALSAVGVLVADVIKDQSQTVMLTCDSTSLSKLPRIFKQMEREAAAILKGEGFSPAKQRHERSLAMRYRGQSFELNIKETSKPDAAFHRAHRERYGYAQAEAVVEIVSARLRSIGVVGRLREDKPLVKKQRIKAPRTVMTSLSGRRVRVGVYRRDELFAGSELATPCIVTEYSGTTLIPGDCLVKLDDFGNLIVTLGTGVRARTPAVRQEGSL